LDRIFDPYFSTKQAGSGLGVATTYSIIKRHGGHIAVESKLGEGTTFTLYLPAIDSPALPDAKRREPNRLTLEQSASALVLDDDEMVCAVVMKMLQKIGFAVETVTEGEQAIERYRQSVQSGKPFEVLILDLTIPGGIGGKEVVKSMLEIDPRASIIVSSGYAEDPVLGNHAEYGFKGVLGKPYDMKMLEEVLHQVMD
jgi:CheY-like chemotaxis protein